MKINISVLYPDEFREHRCFDNYQLVNDLSNTLSNVRNMINICMYICECVNQI